MRVLTPLTGSAGLDVSSANVDTINLGSSGSENSDVNVDNLTVWANADFKNNVILGSSTADTVVSNGLTVVSGSLIATGSLVNLYSTSTSSAATIAGRISGSLGVNDIATKIGTTVADGFVAAAPSAYTKLVSFRTGIGGAESEKVFITALGQVVASNGFNAGSNGAYVFNVSGFAANASTSPFIVGTGWALPQATPAFQFYSTTIFTSSSARIAVFYNGSTTGSEVLSIGAKDGALRSPFGTGSTDVATKVGTSVADVSASASAKLLSVRTGLGGSEVEYFYVTKNMVSASAFVGDGSGLTNLSVTGATADLRKLLYYINNGPAESYATAYLEISPANSVYPTSSIWYTDASKTAKIYEEYYERYSGSATLVQPNPITYKIYAADGTSVLLTATDTISYNGIYINSVSRSIA